MRKFGKESASPDEKGDKGRIKSGPGWLKNHWCLLSVCAVVVVAFLLRTVFVYGLSSGGGFALSGGSGAQNHLHVVESILDGSFVLGSDAAVNYPIGGLNVVPPLMDFIAAGVAGILGMFGMSTTESASAALAVLPPILGALTCIPVYAIGKELFGDKRIGVVAALIFAFLSLPISSSVFSNGTEYALAAFLISCMSYFLIRTVRLMESGAPVKQVYLHSIVSGLYLGLIAWTWNGFGLMILVVGVPLMLQIGLDRINGKNFMTTLVGHSLTLILGVAIAAVYYIPAGLWDAVFSGPLLLAVLIVLFGFLFKALETKPWITVIPSLLVVLAVVLVALYFAAPELFSALVSGNTPYTGIMSEMVTNHVSMSNVSSYYGWLTMWLPLCLAIYETYVYLRKNHSASQLFMVTWLYIMYFAVWSSYSSAAVIGSVFAVGSAAVIVKILVRANIPEWVKSIRTAGFPSGFRKLIKPLPLASVLITALLVVAPNFTYAVDAGMANNTDSDHFFSGNTQFVVKTGDSYPMGNVWNNYSDEYKDGAAVVWVDYIADAVAQGKFDVIADAYGEGNEETASMILAKGSQGMTAALMLRLLMAEGIENYKDSLVSVFGEETYNVLNFFIDKPSEAKKVIDENPGDYGYIRSDIEDVNAVYLASVNYLTSNFDVTKICDAYDAVRDGSGKSINYVILDPSLLPMSYNDGNSFSTMAYFAGYSTDNYGAATQFFTYNTYYGYTTYKDAMYDTFLWKAMIGPSASDAGYTSSYSYLYALSASDGSVKAYPGYGLSGYEVDYWQVMYNPDKNATSGSDGWTYMPIQSALDKQAADGGLINYLSSIVVLKYTGITSSVEETISVETGASAEGLVVDIYAYDNMLSNYVLASSTVVGADNKFTVPAFGANDKVVIRNGSVVLASAIGSIPSDVLGKVATSGKVVYGEDEKILENSDLSLTLVNVTTKKDVRTFKIYADGTFDIFNVLPGQYTADIRNSSGTSVSSSTITLVSGSNDGLVIKPTTYNMTVTVKNTVGKLIEGYDVYAEETTSGTIYSATTDKDGKAVLAVMSGTYNVYADYAVEVQSKTVSKSSTTVNLTISSGEQVLVNSKFDYPIYLVAGDYMREIAYNSDSNKYELDIPKTDATDRYLYTIYGTNGSMVVLGQYYEEVADVVVSVNCNEVPALNVTGKTTAKATVIFTSTSGIAKGASVTAVADSDGKYSIYLPAGDYTVNAYSGSDKAYLGNCTVSSENKEFDIALVDGRTIKATVKAQSGASAGYINQPFVYIKATTTLNGVEYSLYGVTGSDGTYTFHVPDNTAVNVFAGNDTGVFSNVAYAVSEFTKEFNAAATGDSKTFYIDCLSENEVKDLSDPTKFTTKNYVKPVSVTFAYDIELTSFKYNSWKIQINAGESVNLIPGQYTAEIKTDNKYFDGTIYIYPGSGDIAGLDVVAVKKVELTYNESDVITVSSDGGKYWHEKGTYWFKEKDDDGNYIKYYITSTNGSGSDKKVNYAMFDTESSVTEITVVAENKTIKVTGSVGVEGDGTLYVSKDGKQMMKFDVEDGQFTMNIPSDWTEVTVSVEVDATIDGYDYTYSRDSVTLTGLSDGAIRNIAVTGGDNPIPDTDVEDFDVSVDSVDYADGRITAKVTVNNKSDGKMTYVITSGTAVVLEKLYSVTVNNGSSGSITVVGYCNKETVALGDVNLTLTVSDVNGAGSITVRLNPDAGVSGTVEVDDSSNDAVTASQYRYAVTVKNSANIGAKNITLSVTGADGWDLTYTDGKVVNTDGKFLVPGYKDTVLYVCLTSLDGTGTVPSIKVTITGDYSGSLSLEPEKLTLNVDSMTVSGGDSMNSQSKMPVGVWFMIAVGLILFVATLYLGSKRGVFSRKN